tara:strand:+ start:5238 stop:6185 length:948 start_codon:yes stop_codon:yes gene_type:complete
MINYLNLYKVFFYLRYVEETISKKYSEGKMRCPTHLSIGQEAISAIFSCLVKKKDYTISMHRPHTHYLAKGGNLNALISELYGKANGCSKGRGGSMHLVDESVNFMGSTSILGNNIPIGIGLGLSSKTLKKNNITYIFLGDAAVEQGSFYESLNFAVVNNLKVIFICENNEFSVYSNLSLRQPKNRKIFQLAKSIGVNSNFSTGKKLEDIYKKMKNAIDYVNKNKKPYFLEIKTSRWIEHCGPNDDSGLGYRSLNKLRLWKKNDFLISLKKKLNTKSNITKKIENKIKSKVLKAFKFAEKSKFPKIQDLLTNVYE